MSAIESYNYEQLLKPASFSFNEINNRLKDLKHNYIQIKNQAELLQLIIHELSLDKRKNVINAGASLKRHIEKQEAEIARVRNMYLFDRSYPAYKLVAGVDEVGRGPLAGPIAAAAVILRENALEDEDLILGLNDSKKLSPKQRQEISKIIMEKTLCYRIDILDNNTIDNKGIGWCNNEVLKRAAVGLEFTPELVLSDGYAIKNIEIPNKFVIKGDSKSAAIAAASILAKVYRDKLMEEYSRQYPFYGFEHNSGYGTEAHISGLKAHGPCKLHRMSFLRNIL